MRWVLLSFFLFACEEAEVEYVEIGRARIFAAAALSIESSYQ